jgi:hypothetical protein
MRSLQRYFWPPLAALALVACGGGSASDTGQIPATGQAPVATEQTPATAQAPPTSSSQTAVVAISGNAATSATVGQAYSFTPAVTNSSGGTLTFSIDHAPSWSTFSSSTGTLSGTPAAGDVGTDSGIVISVSDGSSSAALNAFNITVAAAPASAAADATVGWTAPSQNSDGSPLKDLAGFRILYGTDATHFGQAADVNDPKATTYTLRNLTSGKWYFGVVALNSQGLQSAVSSVTSKVIQ